MGEIKFLFLQAAREFYNTFIEPVRNVLYYALKVITIIISMFLQLQWNL